MSLWELIFGFSEETKRKFPEPFVNADIDRHGHTRQVPMEVLSLGMGRTGTASMKAALTTLGYPTCHGFDMHANKRDVLLWDQAFEIKYHPPRTSSTPDLNQAPFWDQLLGHVSATTDTPCNAFAPELIRAYPSAKIILVQRDIETWYASFEKALIRPADHLLAVQIFSLLDPYGIGYFRNLQQRGFMQGQFRAQNADEWRANARRVYREHYAEICEVLKDQPERLLEYELGSGWGPLCAFLGKEVPREPFPRVNESASHDEFQRVVGMVMVRRVVGNLLVCCAPVVAGWVAWRWYSRT